VFTHVLAVGESGPWSFSLDASVKAAFAVSAYGGVNTAAPVDGIPSTKVNSTTGLAQTAEQLTPSGTNRLLITAVSSPI
jgi:hypothetical protein